MPESCTDRPTKAHEFIFLLTKNGGNPLIWRARDTGEWSYNPDLSEVVRVNTGPPGFDQPGGNAKGFRGGAFCNNSTFKNEFGGHRTTSGNVSEKDSLEPTGIEEIPRWKGFDYFYDAEAIKEERQGDTHPRGSKRTPPIETAGIGHKDWSKYMTRDDDLIKRNKRSVWTVATQPYAEAHFATFPEEIPKLCILAGSRVGDTILDPFFGSGTTGKVAIELGRKCIGIELNPEYVKLAENRTNVTPGML
jgi:hypothetical protein